MGDEEAGKLFIGGVDKGTSKDDFRAFFEERGELTDWVLMKDPVTIGRNRGFGFVTYKDPEVAKKVLSSGPLILDGKKLDPKICQKREDQRRQNDRESGAEPDSPNKLFVGGIAQTSTKDSIEAAFSSYGKVLFVQLMSDRNTGNHRGFAFITFESPEPVEMLRKQRFVQCDDKTVECKPAESRYRFQGAAGGPGGGRGGQWGAGGGGGPAGGNWQGPQGGQGDYNYQSGGWGGQPAAMGGMWGQQPQMAGSYGNQGGYGQQGANSWNTGYGGGYGGQAGGQYGGGYGAPPYGNQYGAQGNYAGAGQNYSNYGGGYGTPAPQQAGQYGAQGGTAGYNQAGYGAGYSNSNNYQQPPAANTASDPNSSGGPMPASYGQRMGNNAQPYHPYRRGAHPS